VDRLTLRVIDVGFVFNYYLDNKLWHKFLPSTLFKYFI
jgi:hypothetical protein